MTGAATDSSSVASKPTRWKRWCVDALIVLIALTVVFTMRTRHLLEEGRESPELSLRAMDGTRTSLAELRGESATLVHFWATWCGVCHRQVGTLNALYQSLGVQERIVAVAAGGSSIDEVQAFIEEYEVDYPVFVAEEGASRDWGVSRFPTNYVIDSQGLVSARDSGLSAAPHLRFLLSN